MESKMEGKCEDATCPQHGMSLNPCECTDGKHYGHAEGENGKSQDSKKEKTGAMPEAGKSGTVK